MRTFPILSLIILATLTACGDKKVEQTPALPKADMERVSRIKVIFDTDANNELDDQHALAYMLFNGDIFDVRGITVNATFNGGDIQEHYEEARRILQLTNLDDRITLLQGANGSFEAIAPKVDEPEFDGHTAVDFLLEETHRDSVVIVAVGKLTNIALALKKDPDFADRTRIVWLGSNYPDPGEYNQDNDTIAMNYVLNSDIPFEMVTVRYGKPSGTDAVAATQEEVNRRMPGLGPTAKEPVTGRHGGSFRNFGDYSVNLFEHIDYHTDPPSRPLFDMVALAILKNGSWGKQNRIPAPILIDNKWVERPDNERMITVWENFDKESLLNDFYKTMEDPVILNEGQD